MYVVMWVMVYYLKFYLFIVILVHPGGVQSVRACVCGNTGATNTVKMF